MVQATIRQASHYFNMYPDYDDLACGSDVVLGAGGGGGFPALSGVGIPGILLSQARRPRK